MLCLLFLVWFASGAVLAFVPFPALGDNDRLAGSQNLILDMVKVTPAQALRTAGGGDHLTLLTAVGRPVYLAQTGSGPLVAVDATNGAKAPLIDARQAQAAAAAFARTPARAVTGPIQYDQWVVHQGFDPWRPFFKVSIDDVAGTQLYVSARTGQVVQRTAAQERAWNWAGAITHWLYFTILRKSFAAWDQTVWWVSLVGLATAIVGTWLGVYRTVKRMKGRRPDWSPFHGWLRWHHGIGLGVAVFVLTWIFSGWLSMDHGRLFSRGAPGQTAEQRYEGTSLQTALSSVPVAGLATLEPSRRISFTVVGGHPVAAAEGGPSGPEVILLDTPKSPPMAQVPLNLLTTAASRGWRLASPAPHGPEPGDALYRLADDLPARAIRLALSEPNNASVYIDPVTGRALTLMDNSRKAYAWVYFAAHTFNFPILIDRPILRRTLEMIPLFFGFAFSVTGLVIAIKRLRIAAAG